jgi:hypothetical protein
VKKLRDTRSASAMREAFIAQLNARLALEASSPSSQDDSSVHSAAGAYPSSLQIPSGPIRSSSVGATPSKHVRWAPEPALVRTASSAAVEAAYATDPVADAAEEEREAEELRARKALMGIGDEDDDELSPEQQLQATMLRSPHACSLSHGSHSPVPQH